MKKLGGPRKLTESQEVELGESYADGATIHKLASQVGMTPAGVYSILCRRKVAIRSNKKWNVDESYFSQIDSDTRAWILGFIAADGTVRLGKRSGTLRIMIHQRDRVVLEQIKDAMQFTGPVNDFLLKTPSGKMDWFSSLAISSKQIVEDLGRHGVVPCKSLIMLPWASPGEWAPGYFRGLVDGDGGWRCARDTCYKCYFCGTREVVAAFADFVFKLTGDRKSVQAKRNIFNVGFSGRKTLQRLAREFYASATIFLPRKKAIADQVLALPEPTYRDRRDWSHITSEQLLAMRNQLGTWKRVSSALGLSTPAQMVAIRHRLGMNIRPLRRT